MRRSACAMAVATLMLSSFGTAQAQDTTKDTDSSSKSSISDPVESMADTFESASRADPTSSKVTGKEAAKDSEISQALGTASQLDVKQYSSAMSEALVDSGVDEETAGKAARASTSVTNAVVTSASAEDISTLSVSGPACGAALAALGAGGVGIAGGAVTGGTSAAAGTAVASAAVPGMLGCATTAGAALRISGKAIKAYEEDPDAPQMVEVIEDMDSSSPLGKEVLNNMPADQRASAKAAMDFSSKVAKPLAKMKFGDSLIAYGDAATKMGKGDPTGTTDLLPISVALGSQMFVAVGESMGMDTSGMEQAANSASDNISSDSKTSSSKTGTLSESQVSEVKDVVDGGSDVDEDTTKKSDDSEDSSQSDKESSSKDSKKTASSSTSSKDSNDDSVDEDASDSSSSSESDSKSSSSSASVGDSVLD